MFLKKILVENKQKLIDILGCPVCHGTLSFLDDEVECENCDIAFIRSKKGVTSFICERMYESSEVFNKAMEIIKYWGYGWEKRLKEQDHSFLFEGSEEDLRKYRDKKMQEYRERRNVGGLFTTEVDFGALENKICLNIGCGAVTEALMLTEEGGAHCIAMDITIPAVEATISVIEGLNKTCIGIQSDARFIPLQDNSVDFIYSSGVLHHSENISRSINEVYRVLKPSGFAYIGLYSNTSVGLLSAQLKGMLRGNISRKRMEKYLSNNTEVAWRTKNRKNPHTRTFGKRDCKRLFTRFKDVIIRKGSFRCEHVPKLGKLSRKFRQNKMIKRIENSKLLKSLGMGIYIKAEK